ncbi:replication fork protection component Swi3-domain-containing protein [Podospora appendiculata]|uniref:Chromosome segregation in meiosis protein n=1 Tax=Podospora appendiculata TaxID=314037 RepID=A0AAE0XLL4_9PEZI|nr:replication fork protection component Swi3-domain-containing protein [Podospora appendiculata]
MPPKTTSKPSDTNAFVNDYLADWDEDDPFRSPSPEPAAKKKNDKTTNEKKRKGTDTLGIEQELDLKKKPRAPRVKLDETRLLSEKGLPKVRKMGPKLKLKGKGHEFSDASRLLSFYQEWLDDLFPKATFLDALAMVEKAGHKTVMRNQRLKWIEEGRPKPTATDEVYWREEASAPRSRHASQPAPLAPIFEQARQDRPGTPPADDLFGDEDIYNATPRADPAPRPAPNDIPDDDDLDALMAEAETSTPVMTRSIFGGGGVSTKPAQASGEPDEDDLDALMAESEAQAAPSKPSQPAAVASIFGGDKAKGTPVMDFDDYDNDLDALMVEAEERIVSSSGKDKAPAAAAVSSSVGAGKTATPGQDGDDDDLDALMAEAETRSSAPVPASSKLDLPAKQASAFEDEEEAMAEMDGLW